MARKGRPRQSGKRKGGRLVKDLLDGIRQANPKALERRELFGVNGWDAIGRAFAMGLLGEGDEAKERLDKARRYAQIHFAVFAPKQYRCALDRSPVGGTANENAERAETLMEQRVWITDQWAKLTASGHGPWFDMLVDPLRLYTDCDPKFLAHLIENEMMNRARAAAKQPRLPADYGHWLTLKAALQGLDALVPFRSSRAGQSVERKAA